MTMKEHYFKGLFYMKNGFKKGRKTLVFVHGLSSSSSAWVDYEKKFEGNYNILSLDLRGHGKSFRPRKYAEYAIQKFSGDLYSLIMHEHIKKFTIIAHSFATIIALDFMIKHQNLLDSAVLLS